MRKIRKITPYTARVIVNKYIKITAVQNETINQRISNLKEIQKEYKKWMSKKIRSYKSKSWKTRIKRKREFYRELAAEELRDVLKQDIKDMLGGDRDIDELIREMYRKNNNYYNYQSRANSNWIDDIEYLQSFLGDWFMDVEIGTSQKILSRDRIIAERWNGDIESFYEDYNRYFMMKSKGVI